MSEFHHKLVQRKVRFDFSDTPLHWVPGEAEASQVMNVLHMLLPSGELWFCRLYNKALPLVSDARLRDDVQGFIRQEAMHSRAHDGAIQRYLSRFDIDSKPFTDKMDFLFERLLCDYPLGQNRLTRALDGWWLRQRCAIIAAVEHFTCVLGKWVLEARELDRRGSDQDPSLRGAKRQGFLRTWWRLGKQGLLPNLAHTFRDVARYFNPWYHPEHEANTQEALEYLANSPAARRAANA